MHPSDQLEEILPAVSRIVAAIDPAQMNDPTPCANFTVHDVIDHMVVLGGTFAYWFRGEEAPEITAPAAYGVVPVREFTDTMNDLLESVRSPQAMERSIAAPVGEMSGERFARFVALDGLVHGWDLARATAQTIEVDEAVVDEVASFASTALVASMRDGDTFAPPTTPPASANAIDRLAAWSGRLVE